MGIHFVTVSRLSPSTRATQPAVPTSAPRCEGGGRARRIQGASPKTPHGVRYSPGWAPPKPHPRGPLGPGHVQGLATCLGPRGDDDLAVVEPRLPAGWRQLEALRSFPPGPRCCANWTQDHLVPTTTVAETLRVLQRAPVRVICPKTFAPCPTCVPKRRSHEKSRPRAGGKVPELAALGWSGRQDLNLRPPGPEGEKDELHGVSESG